MKPIDLLIRLNKAHLTTQQLTILVKLAEGPSLLPPLCSMLGIHKNTLYGHMSKMLGSEMVSRKGYAAETVYSITPAGAKEVAKLLNQEPQPA